MYKVIVCTILGNPVNNYYDQEVSKERMYTWKCIPRNRKPQLTLMRVTNSYRAVNQNFIETWIHLFVQHWNNKFDKRNES